MRRVAEDALFVPDFRSAPYWWERTPRPRIELAALPLRTDVAVVGSGYTGLHAALVTARGGRDTLVLDAGDAGFGCSTRNGGQVSTCRPAGAGAKCRGDGIVVPMSFSNSHYVAFPPREQSLRWCRHYLDSPEWLSAIPNLMCRSWTSRVAGKSADRPT